MKRIILAIAAITAIAACTKSEVTYEAPGEIGFNVVAGNITKAPVTGAELPTTLNMFVNSYVQDDVIPTSPDYIANGEFENRTDTKTWGGITPYYWPNEQRLQFSGFTRSGNFVGLTSVPAVSENDTDLTASYNPSTDVLTIKNYTPGNSTGAGVNDLMWFPSTVYEKANGYGRGEDKKFPASVPVDMYHTCSWLTFMVQGDATTGGENSTYTITSLTINGIDLIADVTCTGKPASTETQLAATTLKHYVVWTTDVNPKDEYEVAVYKDQDNKVGIELKNTCVKASGSEPLTYTPKNIEKNNTKDDEGNVVVIPQTPGTIDITWTYESAAGAVVTDSATGLDLKLAADNTQSWEPGKHYIYTITLKANEILIAPTPIPWTDGTGGTVTVE